jgi:sugar lactone lactonase YvrE
MTVASRSLCGLLLAASFSSAGNSAAWETNTYQDFLKGRFHGVSLTRDGRLTLAPTLETLASTGEAGVWSVVAAKDGTLFFATGHRGRVYQLKPGGQPSLLWAAPLPEVFALTLDEKGRLYAASSPNGNIYRIHAGKAVEFFDPKARYIWALAAAPDGHLYAATGDQGQIFRISPSGQGELYYETGQAHVTSLALDAQGRLLAGTEPNGILYRIEAKDKAFVLYDSSLPEIRSIVPAPDGSLFVAALGGTLAQKHAQAAATAAAAQPAAGLVTTTITVTAGADAAAAQTGVDLKPKPEPAKPASGTTEVPPPVPVIDLSADKSALYRIWPDQTVETLWSSKEENVYDLTVRGADLVFSTDLRGRIYRLSPDLKATLLVETREGETTRLLEVPQGLVAATSNLGRLYRLNGRPSSPGSFESPVHDAGNAARWGRLEWRADSAPGQLSFRTRSGNSARPDKTWSDWSTPISNPTQAAVSSPNARYIQWQVELLPTNAAAPLIDSVSLSYQPRNNRPVVRSIQITPQWIAAQSKPAAPAAQAPVSYSITVTDSGDAGTPTSSGTPTQALTRSGSPQLYIAWQADDPDADRLSYNVYYRAEDEREWKLLKPDLTDNVLLQDAEVFADGRYLFRVAASDRLTNSPSTARDSDLVSQPVLIDQTPPRVVLGAPRRTSSDFEIDCDVSDDGSAIRRAEYSLNGASWRLLDPADGIADSRQERFTVRIPATPGEHSLVVRAFDSAANPGAARLVLR